MTQGIVLVLTREDLPERVKTLGINEISTFDFLNEDHVTSSHINHAGIILFKDDDNSVKTLKDRYRV